MCTLGSEYGTNDKKKKKKNHKLSPFKLKSILYILHQTLSLLGTCNTVNRGNLDDIRCAFTYYNCKAHIQLDYIFKKTKQNPNNCHIMCQKKGWEKREQAVYRQELLLK